MDQWTEDCGEMADGVGHHDTGGGEFDGRMMQSKCGGSLNALFD